MGCSTRCLPPACPPQRVQLGYPVPSNGSLRSLPRSYIYQKRWVKLDADYLRYFDSEKVSREGGFGDLG